jgi:hypothetical protein
MNRNLTTVNASLPLLVFSPTSKTLSRQDLLYIVFISVDPIIKDTLFIQSTWVNVFLVKIPTTAKTSTTAKRAHKMLYL